MTCVLGYYGLFIINDCIKSCNTIQENYERTSIGYPIPKKVLGIFKISILRLKKQENREYFILDTKKIIFKLP